MPMCVRRFKTSLLGVVIKCGRARDQWLNFFQDIFVGRKIEFVSLAGDSNKPRSTRVGVAAVE